MKNAKKILSLVMALSLSAVCLTGCGKKAEEPAPTDTEATDGFTMDELRVGTNAEFPPFEFIDSELGVVDEFAGIDIEIANEIAASIGAKPVVNNMDFDSLLIALQNGQIDVAMAGMTITEERKQQVDFSDPYYVATQVMIVPESSDITKAADMEGKKIGVIDGYTGQTIVEEMGYEFSGFKKGADAVLDLANGKLDVVVIDSATADKFVAENEGLKIVTDADAYANEEYGIAVKKGNTELLNAINAKIAELNESGKVAEFANKYN